MKKILCCLLAGLMLMSVIGCSPKQEQNNEQSNEQSDEQNEFVDEQNEITDEQNEITDEQNEITEIINADGKVFTPDLTTTGVTSTEIPLNSNKIELCGKTYIMPIKMSDLMADGWELLSDNFKNEIEPKTKISLIGFTLKNKDGAWISLEKAYNNTDTAQKLEGCLLTSFSMDGLDKSAKTEFILPGGVVNGTTAGDVFSIYGNPNNSELFKEYSYSLEKQLTYNVHKDSGLSFSYTFNDDGILYYAKISANID